jgi:hypothetical protein
MKTIGVLLRKPVTWYGKIISAGTWLWNIGTKGYQHGESLFTETDECYSSTIKDNGVRILPRSEVVTNPEEWDVAWVEMPDDVYDAIYSAAQTRVGIPYDKSAIIFSFINPFNWGDKKGEDYCIEAVIWAMGRGWFETPKPGKLRELLYKFLTAKRMSPRRLSRVLAECGYEIKPYTEAPYKVETA